jgi:aspartate aminotransferase
MMEDLNNAKDGSAAMFHVCAHNPTGVDPTPKQWETVLETVLRKKMFSCFDSAYQGFATGCLEKDAYSLRLFAEHTDNLCLFQSFAKNFGIYGERAGVFSVVTGSKAEKDVVNSRIKQIARPIYSNPPIHGARIVDIILQDPELEKMWHSDLELMSGRIKEMRSSLVSKIIANGSKHNWDHFVNQIGMFAFTGMNKDMVNELREKYAIYMTMDGRISIAGLNTNNVDYIAEAFHKVTDGKKF